MARLFILNVFFVLVATTTSLTKHNPKPKPRPKQNPHAFVLPVFKDTKTGIYYANVTVGKPSLVVNLAVDVRGSALWFRCDKLGYNSTTYTPILCGSNCCKQTKDQCLTCLGTYGPSCRNDTCHAYLQTQMTYNTVLASLVKDDTRERGEDNYYIDVKSIQVNGKKLSFNHDLLTFNKTSHWGGTKISNIIPYTLLETSIYKALAKAFVGKAQKRKAIYPFTDCFSYKSFGGKSLLEKEVPVISLVLGGGAKWDIYGPNSLVKVKKTVLCLAFVDAGDGPRIPIEIGGYQMEDNLVEFDLDASKFSFSSSLLRHNTSCSGL
ncbi:hypothetical protein DY000_02043523 [Brassica cretica]|uniref:Peptidase A1 domain-containing protein n=1 Tax=Brassica cretica TaxID=69181 RepID=A0ABQ7BAY2_BRACR|nr:hypothetical protein DY000_02043523 [Brassica cretica]